MFYNSIKFTRFEKFRFLFLYLFLYLSWIPFEFRELKIQKEVLVIVKCIHIAVNIKEYAAKITLSIFGYRLR